MNTNEIGKFISNLRKEHNMTQKQLAELLCVSDKAVSRWETGKGLPDTATMPLLCKTLGVTMNELLSAERLTENNYHEKAEENIVQLMRITEDNKKEEKNLILRTILGMIALVSVILGVIYFSGGLGLLISLMDLPSMLVLLTASMLMIGLGGQMKYFWISFGMALTVRTDDAIEKKKVEIQRCIFALKYAMKTFVYVSMVVFIITLVVILIQKNADFNILKNNLAVASIIILYAALINIFILPFYGLLNKKII